MASHTAYFDASGDRGTSLLAVAGYISTREDWESFDVEWKAVLGRARVPYFHRKKFISKQPPFTNMKWAREETRRTFLADLIRVISRNVDWCPLNILPIADWEMVNSEYCMQEERLTPFAVVGCMAITSTHEWCRANTVPLNDVEFIFEDGDGDKGDFMHWSKKCFGKIPTFKAKFSSDANPSAHPLTPLQACDFIAGEVRRAESDVSDPETDLETFKFRQCLEQLLDRTKCHDNHEKWNVSNLRKLCEKHGIKKR